MSVCLAKIGIVIDDRFPFLGVLQKFYHTSPQDRVQGIIRAKHENIVFLDLRQGHLQPLRRVILVEDIISVLIVVQKSEWYRTFPIGETVYELGRDVVIFHEIPNHVANPVVAQLADKGYGDIQST